jgi:transcriptional regulator with XRE-family HTH domain
VNGLRARWVPGPDLSGEGDGERAVPEARFPSGIGSDTVRAMHAAATLRRARARSGLSLRDLARRAGTSHATLSAYETGRTTPGVDTLDRIVRAAGFELDAELIPAVDPGDPAARGRELVEVLELAALFPARHAATLEYPPFGRVPSHA